MLQRGWLIQAACGLASLLSRCFPLPKNALLIACQRRGHLAARTADTRWAKAGRSRTSLTFPLHPPWQRGGAAVGWGCPFQAGVARWREEGPCRGCSSPSYLPLPATVGVRGNLGVGRNMWGTLAGWECVSGRFNRRAGCPAGSFSKSSVHGFPWLGVKGSFCFSQVKHRSVWHGKGAGLALTML